MKNASLGNPNVKGVDKKDELSIEIEQTKSELQEEPEACGVIRRTERKGHDGSFKCS